MSFIPTDVETNIVESKNVILKYLPKYAEFLLSHYLDELTLEVIKLSHEEEVSYFQNYSSLTDEEYYDLNFNSLNKLLSHLSGKNIEKFIEESTNEYMCNRMPVVDKEDILAQDIIIHSMIIRKGFRHFLKHYTSDTNYFILVMDDVENFMSAYQVSLFNAYLQIQQEKLQKANEELLYAQKLSKMGSFSWNLRTGASELTESANAILMLDNTVNLEVFFSYVHEDDRENVKAALEDAIHHNGNYECEYNYVKDGVSKHIHAIGVVTYENGQPISMHGSIIDKTTEYNLIQKLKKSEEVNTSM